MFPVLVVLVSFFVFPAKADVNFYKLSKVRWIRYKYFNSAKAALEGWRLVASDAVKDKKGKILLVTYWVKESKYIRCVDHKDASFYDEGSICYEPVDKNR